MMMSRLATTVGLACIAMLTSGAALAQEADAQSEPAYLQPGPYVFFGGSIGVDQGLDDEISDVVQNSVDIDDGIGIRAKVGYRVIPYFAQELEVEYLTGIDVEVNNFDPNRPGEVKVSKLEYVTFMTNSKFYYPFRGVQPYALVGFGLMHINAEDKRQSGIDDDETDAAMRAGGGLDLYLTDHFAISADVSYVVPFGDIDDFDYISVGFGAQYKF